MLVLVAVVLPLNLLHVAKLTKISPLDELMHIDYLERGSAPGFLRMRDTFTPAAMNEIVCRGHPTQTLPVCGDKPYNPEEFSWKGHNLASSHSPWYYVATGLAVLLLRAILPGDSIVTWARALGSVWLLAGFALTLRVGRRVGVEPWSVVPFLIVLALSPSTEHAATIVNPDATSVFAGSLVLLAAVRAVQRVASPIWVFLAALTCMLLDPGNLLAVLAVIGYLVLSGGPTVLERVRLLPHLLGGVVVGEIVNRFLLSWLGVVDDTGNPQEGLFSVAGLTGPMVWGEAALLAMLPPTKGYLFPQLETPGHLMAVAAAAWLVGSGLVVAAAGVTGRRGSLRWASPVSSRSWLADHFSS